MSVVLDFPFSVCVWISAAVAIIYTLLGGLYSVAYTDIVQLILLFISLVSLLLATPFIGTTSPNPLWQIRCIKIIIHVQQLSVSSGL